MADDGQSRNAWLARWRERRQAKRANGTTKRRSRAPKRGAYQEQQGWIDTRGSKR